MKKIIILIALYIVAINLSIKIFNTYDAWIGIGAGVFSTTALIYSIVIIIKKLLKK
jgi:hypothetical protein